MGGFPNQCFHGYTCAIVALSLIAMGTAAVIYHYRKKQ